MHYNLKVEIERVRGDYVIQMEISSVGRCRRQRIVSKTFDAVPGDMKAAHDQMLSEVQAYETASRPAEIIPTTAADIEWNKEALDPDHNLEESAASSEPILKYGQKVPNKKSAKPVPKAGARKFASA